MDKENVIHISYKILFNYKEKQNLNLYKWMKIEIIILSKITET